MMRIPAALAATFLVSCVTAQAGQAAGDTASMDTSYRAVLHLGLAHASPGPDAVSPVALLDVETIPAPIGAGWKAAVGFQFGLEPLLVMTRPTGTAGATASHANGYTMSETMRFARMFAWTEAAIAGRIGASGANDDAIARNDTSMWAFVADVRVDLRWDDFGAHVAHAAPASRDPIANAWLGILHDQRFHRAGDLSGFDDPTGRLFGGVTLTPIRLTAHGLSFGGGVEFERALDSQVRLPSGVRAWLGAGVDLRRPARN